MEQKPKYWFYYSGWGRVTEFTATSEKGIKKIAKDLCLQTILIYRRDGYWLCDGQKVKQIYYKPNYK